MEKFSEFITEAKDEPYRFVLIWYDDPDDPDEDETNMFRAKMQTKRNPQEDEELQLQDKIDSVPSLMERSA